MHQRTPEQEAARLGRELRKVAQAVRVARPLLAIVGRTWRVRETWAPGARELVLGRRAYILSLWHGNLLEVVWANKFRGIAALASRHGDAEIMVRLMLNWDFTFVRGSSSEGGKEALAAMVEALEDGRPFAITPDGPRGPAGVPKLGVLVASHRSGAPIIPVRVRASRCWRTRSWDRFEIPKPFARLEIDYGAPWYPPSVDDAALAELQRRMGPAHAVAHAVADVAR